MQQAGHKMRFAIAIGLILLLCVADYILLSEGPFAMSLGDGVRKAGHMVIMAAITACGYWGLYRQQAKWLKTIWLLVYFVPLILLPLSGLVFHFLHIDSKPVMKKIGDLRMFFCSPVPFFILYMLPVFLQNAIQKGQKA